MLEICPLTVWFGVTVNALGVEPVAVALLAVALAGVYVAAVGAVVAGAVAGVELIRPAGGDATGGAVAGAVVGAAFVAPVPDVVMGPRTGPDGASGPEGPAATAGAMVGAFSPGATDPDIGQPITQ